jgi:hypothetical protein
MSEIMKQLEAVSPELVLVDPDLARTERARLASAQPVWEVIASRARQQIVAPVPAPPDVEAPPRRTAFRLQQAFAAGVLGLSLFVNGYLLAERMDSTEVAAAPPSVAAAAPEVAPEALAARPAASVAEANAPAEVIAPGPRPGTVASRIEAERRVLARVVEAPAGKLPAKLIDRSSGLAKNNLQAVCTRTDATTFLCVVRPASHRDGEGVYVLYRATRSAKEAFTWSPYRSESAARSQG